MSLRAAVLGAGYFAAFHHDAWRRIDGAELVAIADSDAAKAEAAAGKHSAAARGSLAEMLEADGPDIVDLVVPPPAHAEAIRTALAAKPRAIICQKPFCESLEEARAITAEAAAAGIPLVVHENFRFQPWWRLIRDEIASGRLGQVQNVTFRLRTGDGQGPHAYLDRQPYFQTMPRLLIHETGVHFLDLFRFLLGPAQAIHADLRRLNPAIAGEDAGHVLTHHGDARALFDGNRLIDHAAENHRLTLGEGLVEGSAGTLTLDGAGRVTWRAMGETATEELMAPEHRPGFGSDCVRALQAHVVAHLTDGTPLENRACDYLAILEMEAAAYRSAETGATVPLE